MTRMPLRWLAAVGAVALAPQAAAAQSDVWALTNVRIQTVTRGVIDKGTIVIRNGLIEAVGPSVPIPADARVLDWSGRTVSPGLIDLASTIAPVPNQGGNDTPRGFGAPPAPPTASGRPNGFDPAVSVADELNPAEADLKSARDAGITSVLLAASRGGLRGMSALVPTRDGLERRHVVRAPVGMHFGFNGAQGTYPATLLGVIAYERQTLYDAQRYGLIADRYRADPRGLERPVFDPGLEALVPVVRGSLPAFFAAGNENEIRRAANIAGEFGLKLTVVGATEGWRAADALKGRNAVVSVNFPRPSETTGWAYRLARRGGPDSVRADSLSRPVIEGNAAALHRAGITVALATGGTRPADFLDAVRKAVRAGLPEQAALEALTIRPAEIAGVGRALGSIETGKIANLVVTERGDLLADSSRIRAVFVDGIRYDVTPPPAARAGAGGGGAAAQVGGTWSVTVNGPQGPMDMTLVLTQSGTTLSGSMTSMMGTTQLDEGQVTGRNVSWALTVSMGSQPLTLNFQGEVTGTRMTGSAALGSFGNASFTAEKKP
ncbi:MAG: amidohydrolase family protein [Gemmatimonadales bacterium]